MRENNLYLFPKFEYLFCFYVFIIILAIIEDVHFMQKLTLVLGILCEQRPVASEREKDGWKLVDWV